MPGGDILKGMDDAGPVIALIFLLTVIVTTYGTMAVLIIRQMGQFSKSQLATAQALGLVATTLQSMGERVADLEKSDGKIADVVERMRADLDKHVVNIHVRFDRLPHDIQAQLGAEIARQYRPHPGLLARLFG